jgi:hypothetical protein
MHFPARFPWRPGAPHTAQGSPDPLAIGLPSACHQLHDVVGVGDLGEPAATLAVRARASRALLSFCGWWPERTPTGTIGGRWFSGTALSEAALRGSAG